MALLSLTLACFVLARRFRGLGRRRWAAYCTATGVVAPLVAVAAFPAEDFRLAFAGVVLLVGWASVIAAFRLAAPRAVTATSNAEIKPTSLA